MRRFRFRLERLARVRRIQEEQERERWLAAELARREADAAEAGAREQTAAVEAELRRRQADAALGVDAVLVAQAALERARGAEVRARERTRTATFQAERLRAPWDERRQEVRGLERLEQRARTAWRREELLREAAELDEVAAQRSQAHRPNRGTPSAAERPDAASAAVRSTHAGAAAQGPRTTFRSSETTRPDAR